MLKTQVGELKVSTVRVSDYPDAYPFETMVFRCDRKGYVTSWSECYCERYKTEEEAERGHHEAVAWAKSRGEHA